MKLYSGCVCGCNAVTVTTCTSVFPGSYVCLSSSLIFMIMYLICLQISAGLKLIKVLWLIRLLEIIISHNEVYIKAEHRFV